MQEKLGRKALFIGVSRKKDEAVPGRDQAKEDLDQILRMLDALAGGDVSARVSGISPESTLSPLAERLDRLAVRMQSERDELARFEGLVKAFPLPCAVYQHDGTPSITSRAFDEQAGNIHVPSMQEIREGAEHWEAVRAVPADISTDGKEHHYQHFRAAVSLPDGTSDFLLVWDDVTGWYERIQELERSRKTDEETRRSGIPDESPPPALPGEPGEETPSPGPDGTDIVLEKSDEPASPLIPADAEESGDAVSTPSPTPSPGPDDTDIVLEKSDEPASQRIPAEAAESGDAVSTPSPTTSDEVTEAGTEPPDEDEDALLVASILQSAGFSTGSGVTGVDTRDEPVSPEKETGMAVPVEEPVTTPGNEEKDVDAVPPATDHPVGEDQQIGTEIEVVEFSLGQEAYAIDISLAREIVEMMTITPIPRAPPYLAGVLNLRGEITNIITITTILGVSSAFAREDQKIIVLSSEAAGGENVGIIVDDVRSVSQVPRERIERLGEGVGGKTRTNIKGIIKKEERDGDRKEGSPEENDLILWLDLKKVLHELMNQ